MRYIRTEDGIMKVDDYLEKCEKWQDVKHLITKEKFLQGTQQADTIEELIDMYIIANKNCGQVTDYSLKYLKQTVENKTSILMGDIYGAIWVKIELPNGKTSFRLEPVAIANDDWELVLI